MTRQDGGVPPDRGGAAVGGAAPALVAVPPDHAASGEGHPCTDAGLEACLVALEALAGDLTRWTADGADGADAPDVVATARAADRLAAVADRVRAARARLMARVEADGRWASSGAARTFPEWVARRGGGSVGTARREAAVGRALAGDLPATRDAVTAGRISFEHAQVLATLGPTSDDRRAALASDQDDRNEAFLVRAAQTLGVDDFRRLMRRWGAATDVAAHEREHSAALAREYLSLGRSADGVRLQGFLAAENAETLLTALRAVQGVPAADDERTAEQRQATALAGLARVVLDKGLGGAGGTLVRPHISVHVPFETFRALAREAGVGDELETALAGRGGATRGAGQRAGAAAELDDGTPIPPSVLARLACDGEVSRVVFGPDSAPLDVGRAQRTFTGPQRRAVVARDRCCRFPGCGAPVALGEVHHVRWWTRDGGETATANGVLLCWYHHAVVHQRDVRITWRRTGGWDFAERDGRPITARGGPPLPLGVGVSPPPGVGGSPPTPRAGSSSPTPRAGSSPAPPNVGAGTGAGVPESQGEFDLAG